MVDLPLGPASSASIEVVDPEFAACIDGSAVVERLWTGGRWTEGPVWLPVEGILVWSDIPGNRMLRWREADGDIALFRSPTGSANGNTRDRQGRLVTCEQDQRRITRTERDGRITIIADRINGKRFTSPNDVVVKSDGSVWFTGPAYGSGGPLYEGKVELDGCHVYRADPATGEVRQMTADMVMPNGLAFSLDEKLLYVVDTGSTHHPDGPNHIRVFAVGADDSLTARGTFVSDKGKALDGLRLDRDGRIWAGAGEGVRCYRADGTLLGRIRLPERVANLEFAGADRSRLFMCGTTSVYCVSTGTAGGA